MSHTAAAATLRYAIYRTGNDGYHIGYHRLSCVYSNMLAFVEMCDLRMHQARSERGGTWVNVPPLGMKKILTPKQTSSISEIANGVKPGK